MPDVVVPSSDLERLGLSASHQSQEHRNKTKNLRKFCSRPSRRNADTTEAPEAMIRRFGFWLTMVPLTRSEFNYRASGSNSRLSPSLLPATPPRLCACPEMGPSDMATNSIFVRGTQANCFGDRH